MFDTAAFVFLNDKVVEASTLFADFAGLSGEEVEKKMLELGYSQFVRIASINQGQDDEKYILSYAKKKTDVSP